MTEKQILLFIALFTNCFFAIGQDKPLHVIYEINSTELKVLSIQKLGLRTLIKEDPDFELPVNEKKANKAVLNLKTDGLYKIRDAIKGHIVYLEAGDTVFLKLFKIKNLSKLLANKNNDIPYFHNLTADGKYAWHYLFFDEVYRRTNSLYPKLNIDILKQPMLFKQNCDKALSIGNSLIDSLYRKSLISQTFKNLAIQELNAIYVGWICTPLYWRGKDKFPPIYFEKIKKFKFNDSAYAVMCNDYLQASALYTYYLDNDLNLKNPYSNLKNEINSILSNYSGIIRDKLLAQFIADHIGKNDPSFDSCYQIFLSECKTTKLKNEVIKKFNAYIKPIKNLNTISLEDLLNRTKVQNSSEKILTLKAICNDTMLTLIDCWATWCIPCRNQMPFIHKFEKKYNDKINFVYLSFDKDEEKWKSFLLKNKLSPKQYIINNDFSSEFSQYFDIQSIPRYILISRKGIEILDSILPLPMLEGEFETELKKHIK